MTGSLTISSIHAAMDEALKSDENIIQKLKNQGLILRRSKDPSDWESLLAHVLSFDGKNLVHGKPELHLKLPFHFGMTLHAEGRSGGGDPNSGICGAVTFYIAYSTWEGKFLYVDHLARRKSSSKVLLLQTLAKIAVSLNCARLVWRHKHTCSLYKSPMRNPPQTMNDILTLFMDEPAIKKYSVESNNSANQALQVQEGPWTPHLVQNALSVCLDGINNSDTGSKEFRLRLATSNDLATVTRLIQGLADYVNESHEVHSTSDDYLRDGFSDDPLFYCLLIDRIVVGGNQGDGETENKKGVSYYTCGYAAVYFGYILGEGRFLYLEDLFLEVEHRKYGGGSLVMKTLARIALTLQCSRLYWQALDWNTPALQFYNSMGATVQEGVVMTRYCGNSLQEFAALGNETEEE